MHKLLICAVVAILCAQQSWAFSGGVKKFASDLSKIMQAAKKSGYVKDKALLIQKPIDIKYHDIFFTFKAIKRQAEVEHHHALSMIARLAKEVSISEMEEQLNSDMTNIHKEFMSLLQTFEKSESLETKWFNHSSKALLQMRYSIRDLRKLFLGAVDSKSSTDGLLNLLQFEIVRRNETCGPSAFTVRKLLVDIVQAVIMVEIKVLAVLTFVIPILSLQGGFIERISDDKRDFELRLAEYIRRTKEIIRTTPGTLRTCHPADGQWIRDETYIELGGLAQHVIIGYGTGRNLNWMGKPQARCRRIVKDYNSIYVSSQRDGLIFYANSHCAGRINNCVPLDDIKNACLGNIHGIGKRFEWLETDDKLYGEKKGACPQPRQLSRDPNWGSASGHCTCECVARTHYISITPIHSDTANNMVITGLRFIRRFNVLYLQPRQGKLLENGRVDPNLQNWVDLPKNPRQSEISDTADLFFFDDHLVPYGSVLTGVQLAMSLSSYEELYLGWMIYGESSKFDYSTGKLCTQANCTTSLSSPLRLRKQVHFSKQIPVDNPAIIHLPESHPDGFVQVTSSSLDQDFGQTTIPLLEAMEVKTDPPAPLGGFGLVYKSARDSSGFLSLQLHPINYEKYLEEFRDNHEYSLLTD